MANRRGKSRSRDRSYFLELQNHCRQWLQPQIKNKNKNKNKTWSLEHKLWQTLFLLFSCQVLSNSLWPHWLQNTRHLCPLLFARVCPSSCPLNQWCHPTILCSVVPFSFCLQSFLASGSFPMSLFTEGGQIIGASASASVLPMNKMNKT